jgi:hypothetical protein
MILDPGKKLVLLEGLKQAVVGVVFTVITSWRVIA